jgi:hypothetical protein
VVHLNSLVQLFDVDFSAPGIDRSPFTWAEQSRSPGFELMRTGKFQDAELLWRQLAQQYRKDPVMRGNLGVALASTGKTGTGHD